MIGILHHHPCMDPECLLMAAAEAGLSEEGLEEGLAVRTRECRTPMVGGRRLMYGKQVEACRRMEQLTGTTLNILREEAEVVFLLIVILIIMLRMRRNRSS